MSTLLTRLKQLWLRDVLPLRNQQAKEVFEQAGVVEWKPEVYQPIFQNIADWTQRIWPSLLQEEGNLLLSPWELVRSLRGIDDLAHTNFTAGTLAQWRELDQILIQLLGRDTMKEGQILWYHADLSPFQEQVNQLNQLLNLAFEEVDFDSEEGKAKVNRWLFRSTEELTTTPVQGLSGWCWAGSRMRLEVNWGREFQLTPIPHADFYPKPGRRTSCEMLRIRGKGHWLEETEKQGVRLTLLEGKLELIFWKSRSGDSFPQAFRELSFAEDAIPLEIHLPSFPLSQTHRFRRSLKHTECSVWFDPGEKRLGTAFQRNAVWLDELLGSASLALQPHPHPRRHLPLPEHTLVLDQPFGLMLRESRSQLPLLLGWIKGA